MSKTPTNALELTTQDGSVVELELLDQTLKVSQKGKRYSLPTRQVLDVKVTEPGTILISYIRAKAKNGAYALYSLTGKIKDASLADAWVKTTLEAAYPDTKPYRRLKVLVNPNGGPGKAPVIYKTIVQPLLEAAGCVYDTIETTHFKHGQSIAQKIDLNYDAVLTLSGDGLIHEVINGFAEHEQPMKALEIPVVPIPTGSGNGLSLNLLGIKDGFNLHLATLNAIKGKPMKIDLFSVLQGGKRYWSFMTQTVGLMADCDINTEHLRWMGDTRFVYGTIKGILQFKPCDVKVQIKVAETDKVKMAQNMLDRQKEGTVRDNQAHADQLPPLKYTESDQEGWLTLEKSTSPIMYLYAGQGPYVSRDMMQFPSSQPDDGLIDVVMQERTSRTDCLMNMSAAEDGGLYWAKSQKYYKAEAYRVIPENANGILSVDGERYPYETFQLEVHRGLGTVLSPYLRYAHEFHIPKSKAQQ